MRFAAALAAALLAGGAPGPAARAAGGTPVRVAAVRGLPADASLRGPFMDAFRAAFERDSLPAELRSADGGWAPAGARANRFRVTDAGDAPGAWTLEVVVGAPAPAARADTTAAAGRRAARARRSSRGMVVAVTVTAPSGNATDAVASTESEGIAFAAPAAEPGAALAVPKTGYVFPWDEAGRAAAALALEVLHHRAGALSATERFALAPALRTGAGR